MASPDDGRTLEELAAFSKGLAHPARVAVMRELRAAGRLDVADLRQRVERAGVRLDARGIRFHLAVMEQGGLVVLSGAGGRAAATLLRDVALRVKAGM